MIIVVAERDDHADHGTWPALRPGSVAGLEAPIDKKGRRGNGKGKSEEWRRIVRALLTVQLGGYQ
jgi:hypothetical protein